MILPLPSRPSMTTGSLSKVDANSSPPCSPERKPRSRVYCVTRQTASASGATIPASLIAEPSAIAATSADENVMPIAFAAASITVPSRRSGSGGMSEKII